MIFQHRKSPLPASPRGGESEKVKNESEKFHLDGKPLTLGL